MIRADTPSRLLTDSNHQAPMGSSSNHHQAMASRADTRNLPPAVILHKLDPTVSPQTSIVNTVNIVSIANIVNIINTANKANMAHMGSTANKVNMVIIASKAAVMDSIMTMHHQVK